MSSKEKYQNKKAKHKVNTQEERVEEIKESYKMGKKYYKEVDKRTDS